MKVEEIATSRIIPYANNPRHNDQAVSAVAASIKEFGFRQPIVTDETLTILVGHTRLKAAQNLGLSVVPVHIAEGLTEAQKKAYRIADNRLNELAEWDNELLSLELEALTEADFDIGLLGFSDEELDELLAGSTGTEGNTDPDDVPEVPENPVTKLGDIWLMGEHRLMCGDSTSIEDVRLLSVDEKIDICFTSPPYNVSVVITDGNHDKKYLNYKDDLKSEDFSNFLFSFTSIALSLCDYVFVNIQSLSNNKKAVIDYLYKNKEFFADFIIWDKVTAEPAMAFNVLNSQFEFILVFSKKANRSIGCVPFRGNLSNIISLSSRSDKEFSAIHKATFPVKFAEHFVGNFSNNIVFEPFGGTGTTLIACEKTRRKCRIMELEPIYCDVIIKRWQEFTGKKAILERTGEEFDASISEETVIK